MYVGKFAFAFKFETRSRREDKQNFDLSTRKKAVDFLN